MQKIIRQRGTGSRPASFRNAPATSSRNDRATSSEAALLPLNVAERPSNLLVEQVYKKHGSCCFRKTDSAHRPHRLMVASLMHSVQLSSLKGKSDVLGRNKAHFFASAVAAVFIFASTHSAAQQDIDRLGARN